MIDLHSHILPGVDDGAPDLSVSLAMARAAADGGVTTMACTPHILPGIWQNTGPQIRVWTAWLQDEIYQAGIPLALTTGADNHIAPNMTRDLKEGHLLSLADTRYVLVEVPHHVAPVRLDDCFFGLMMGGYIPVLTHPERLSWIGRHYDAIVRLASAGVWIQITAGSLLGRFGSRAQYWAERMLDDGVVHILATDAHNMTSRPPLLAEGAAEAARIVGAEEARDLIVTRPAGILNNEAPSKLPRPKAASAMRGK